ncbi:ABC transporter substrate-binding protein [Halomicrococcus sp. NG-SE-24]|uniref:ABC transporter substrate-binding protein n=1 Tax=Halomicrococcus sp. NG-SE-24 TaxID=3436928 RepID=UPI003D95D381
MVSHDSDRNSRRRFLKATGVGAIAASAGCVGLSGNSGNQGKPIVFGQPAAQTGKWDFLQPGITQATNMAVKEINKAGGPLDRELKIVRRDTSVNPQQARTVVQQLIENDNAIAINGLFSSEIAPLFEFLKGLETPINTPWPGTNFLDTKGGDKMTPKKLSDDGWVWRTTISDTVQTAGGARHALDKGIKRVGVIHGNTAGARTWAEGFMNHFKDGGGSVAKTVEVQEGKSSYQAGLSRLFDADFKAFVVSMGLEDATTLFRDWESGGYGRQPILSDVLADPKLAKTIGSKFDGAWSATPVGQGPYFQGFKSKFNNAGNAEMNAWVPCAYDSVVSTALAIERAGEASPKAIEKNLGPVTRKNGKTVSTFADGQKALKNGEITFQGAATRCNFTQYGNVFGSVGIMTAQADSFKQTDVIKAKTLRKFVDQDEY